MELSLGAAIVVLVIIFFFRSFIRSVVRSADKFATVVDETTIAIVAETKKENTRRVVTAMKELEAMGGPLDFNDAYMKLMGKNVDKK